MPELFVQFNHLAILWADLDALCTPTQMYAHNTSTMPQKQITKFCSGFAIDVLSF